LAELARSNRYSLAVELTATIAHEINQPLGAILVNSETLEAMLQSPAPDLLELREIAANGPKPTKVWTGYAPPLLPRLALRSHSRAPCRTRNWQGINLVAA
jgi:signal transduction histidine kinase